MKLKYLGDAILGDEYHGDVSFVSGETKRVSDELARYLLETFPQAFQAVGIGGRRLETENAMLAPEDVLTQEITGNGNELLCRYCGRELKNRPALIAHEKACPHNPETQEGQ